MKLWKTRTNGLAGCLAIGLFFSAAGFAQDLGAKVEILPESETQFFLTAIDAQVTFVKDDQGRVTHLVLHQGGRDQPAKKIP